MVLRFRVGQVLPMWSAAAHLDTIAYEVTIHEHEGENVDGAAVVVARGAVGDAREVKVLPRFSRGGPVTAADAGACQDAYPMLGSLLQHNTNQYYYSMVIHFIQT